MESKWLKEKDSLYKLIVIENKSYEEVGKLYNVTGSNIKKVCNRLEIPIPSRRKINKSEHFNKGGSKIELLECLFCKVYFKPYYKKQKFCSNTCSSSFRKEETYHKYLYDIESFTINTIKKVKPFILKEQDNKCAICGILPIWNNKPMSFILGHINGRCNDNTRANLRCICHNCESQLPTYKSKNKRSDRNPKRYGGYKNKEV